MRGNVGMKSINRAQKVEGHVWGRVRAGFMMFVPILVTYLVLRFLVDYTDDLLSPLVNLFPFSVPGLSLLLLFVIFYFSGLVLSPRVGKLAMTAQHAVFTRIPVIKSIYGLTEQVAGHLSAYDGHEFSRVVLVEWPKPGVYAIAFVTGNCSMRGDAGERVAVYIPTVPNPTSGMFALMLQSDVVDTDISVEEAIKLVLSGGIVLPDNMNDVDVRSRDKQSDDFGEQGVLIPLIGGYGTGGGYDGAYGGTHAGVRRDGGRNGHEERMVSGG